MLARGNQGRARTTKALISLARRWRVVKWLVVVSEDGGGVDEVAVMISALDLGDDIVAISWSAGQSKAVD